MVPLEMLEKLSFLEGFAPEYLKPLASVAKVVDVEPNEIVFQEKQNSPNIYIVVEGQVALEIWATGRGMTQVQNVGPGKLLGWSVLLGEGPMTATARAVEASRLVVINALQALDACEENPRFGMEFMRRTALALSKRLNATRLKLLDICQDTLAVVSE